MPRLLWCAVVTLVIALLAYSQAVAYFGNESFHLLAAQLINAGKKPYFEARRLPPPGMENAFNLHSRRDEWLAANRFATVCMMANDPRVESLNLFGRYAKNKAINTPNFTVCLFWDRIAAPSEPR